MSESTGVVKAPSSQPRWTRNDLARLEAEGSLPQKYELLDGLIISRMGQGILHIRAVGILNHWLFQAWEPDYVMSQANLEVADQDRPSNAPEPDLTAFHKPLSSLKNGQIPTPDMVDLVIEVSDSTRQSDLTIKAKLYARAGIPEYWVFDIQERAFHVHHTPQGDMYTVVSIVSGSTELAPRSRPSHTIRPDQVLA